jgi:hypothetical protein
VHDLGNNLVLLEGDRKEDRVIVYCTNNKDKCCSGGLPIIPKVNSQFDRGANAEYVEFANSNLNWVIVKSIALNGEITHYWIIDKGFNIANVLCDSVNCDSILHSYVIGPLTKIAFEDTLKQKNIDLHFE